MDSKNKRVLGIASHAIVLISLDGHSLKVRLTKYLCPLSEQGGPHMNSQLKTSLGN